MLECNIRDCVLQPSCEELSKEFLVVQKQILTGKPNRGNRGVKAGVQIGSAALNTLGIASVKNGLGGELFENEPKTTQRLTCGVESEKKGKTGGKNGRHQKRTTHSEWILLYRAHRLTEVESQA